MLLKTEHDKYIGWHYGSNRAKVRIASCFKDSDWLKNLQTSKWPKRDVQTTGCDVCEEQQRWKCGLCLSLAVFQSLLYSFIQGCVPYLFSAVDGLIDIWSGWLRTCFFTVTFIILCLSWIMFYSVCMMRKLKE